MKVRDDVDSEARDRTYNTRLTWVGWACRAVRVAGGRRC